MLNPFSVYLHIPFCREICTYCAFNTYADMDDVIEPFVQAMVAEIDYIGRFGHKLPIHTVFFGGGTPSMLTVPQFESIFLALKRTFEFADKAEISIEANPNDLTLEFLHGLRGVGINRLSVGMQSAKASELMLYHRQHDVEMTHRVIEEAKMASFDNISVDLIFGNPYQSLADWEHTLRTAVLYGVQHISLYGLEVKGGTVLKKQIQAGELPKPNDDFAADMYDFATVFLAESGFEQYEISNWTKPSFESVHNMQYWQNLPYFGFGAGAHGYINGIRTIVVRLPQRYIQVLSNRESQREFPRTPATSKATPIDVANEISETIMVGLRMTQRGINRNTFLNRFGFDFYESRQPAIDRLVALGLVEVDSEKVRLSPSGRLISNSVIADLI